jgi:hypothetical protein
MKELLTGITKTVSSINRSKWLKQFCFEQGGTSLKTFVENRWLSLCKTLESVIINYWIIDKAYRDLNSETSPISGKEEALVQIYSLVKPIAVLIEKAQRTTSFSPLINLIRNISKLMQGPIYDTSKDLKIIDAKTHEELSPIRQCNLQPVTKEMLTRMREAIDSKFFRSFYRHDFARVVDIVMFLHPNLRLSHLSFFCEEEESRKLISTFVENKIKDMTAVVWRRDEKNTSNLGNRMKVTGRKRHSYYSLIDSDVEEEIIDESDHSEDFLQDQMTHDIVLELTAYQRLSLISKEKSVDENLLTWWKDRKDIFPLLHEVSKSYLGTPASSGVLEKDFCMGSILGNRSRTKLNSALFGILMVLNINSDTLPRYNQIFNTVTQLNYGQSLPSCFVDPFQLLEDDSDDDNDA